ncbi:hypothetical protein CEXT_96191 [Caerostris extrusa]|uniref:Uncharacterized protein n=1 Tax=Caerostris extrusa TaxID=172846 RepID=A0AAV4ULM4_CAEEX|nr:hypothetical protein CEXT_96191 [Caerostris extrusa]
MSASFMGKNSGALSSRGIWPRIMNSATGGVCIGINCDSSAGNEIRPRLLLASKQAGALASDDLSPNSLCYLGDYICHALICQPAFPAIFTSSLPRIPCNSKPFRGYDV